MQIIIDISEEDYNFIKKQIAYGITNPLKVCIANGTPVEQESKTDVLDKIRTEISSLIAEYDARCERWKPSRYKPTKGIAESDVAPRSPQEIESNKWGERAEGLERALKIIDKHIKEHKE